MQTNFAENVVMAPDEYSLSQTISLAADKVFKKTPSLLENRTLRKIATRVFEKPFYYDADLAAQLLFPALGENRKSSPLPHMMADLSDANYAPTWRVSLKLDATEKALEGCQEAQTARYLSQGVEFLKKELEVRKTRAEPVQLFPWVPHRR